jgi:arsenate reductase (thioredoxin)
MAQKKRVLFVCEHNSARSQMAEAFLKSLAPERFEVQSAGISPGRLNPLAVKVMKEAGIDISMNRTKGVDGLLNKGEKFDFIITVCDPAASACPVFPGAEVIHWMFEDPSRVSGAEDEKLNKVRKIRDEIRLKIIEWIKDKQDED